MKIQRLSILLFAILISQSPSLFSQELISIDQLRSSDENYVRGIDVGASGNTVVCGSYRLDFTAGVGNDEATINTTGVTSGYIASYDENSDLQFLLGLTSSKFGNAQDVHVAENNAIYVSGDYAGVMELNPLGTSEEITSTGFSPSVNSEDPFLAKYDLTGNLEWYINPVESDYGYGSAIIPSPSGTIIWAGTHSGFLQFEYEGATVTYPDPSFLNNDDSFIFEVNADGQINRHMRATGSGLLYVDQGCYDADGNLYLTGFVQGDVVIEAPGENYAINTGSSNQKFFILQIAPDWSIGWFVSSSGESAYGRGLKVNSFGEIVFAGYYSGVETFSSLGGGNNSVLTSLGERDLFLGKYSTDGILLNASSIGGSNDDFLHSMFLDDEDDLYLSGSFKGEMDFDPSENISLINTGLGTPALFLAKYTASFFYGWTYFAGTGVNFGEDAVGMGLVGNDILLAGNFGSTLNFNPNGEEVLLSSEGGTDGYLVRLTNAVILVTSLAEFVKNPIKVFPNPSQGKISISLNASMDVKQLLIYDLMGKLVYSNLVPTVLSDSTYSLDLPELNSGTYIISLQGKERYSQKLVISNGFE
ncbi:MAG: T9SS type A sorting domain-containing protein [Bacteroidia bacterium]